MGYDIEELRFIGMIHSVSEDEFAASVNEDEGQVFVKAIYTEFVKEGKPKNSRKWVRENLKKCFLYVSKPPSWVGSSPNWPFFEGKPMVFIEQLAVPETQVSMNHASPGSVLYVFGAKKLLPEIPNGWEMVYKVVQQHSGL
jgi:hypothetical protein